MRKIIQIAFNTYTHFDRDSGDSIASQLHALCDDGTIWYLDNRNEWCQWGLPPIPQDEPDPIRS